jgi:hypothetical protein
MKPRTNPLSLAIGLLLASLLAACGPGVGGSGTGAAEEPLLQFGATAIAVCGNPQAPQPAACVTGQATPYADSATQPRVTAQLLDGHIELQAPCAGLKFSGDWAAVGSQSPRFYGSVTNASGTALASLISTPASSEQGLRVELRDAQGALLLGPLTLIPATPGALSAGCS